MFDAKSIVATVFALMHVIQGFYLNLQDVRFLALSYYFTHKTVHEFTYLPICTHIGALKVFVSSSLVSYTTNIWFKADKSNAKNSNLIENQHGYVYAQAYLTYIHKHTWKQWIKMFSLMSNLQTHYQFQLNIQKVDQHTGG